MVTLLLFRRLMPFRFSEIHALFLLTPKFMRVAYIAGFRLFRLVNKDIDPCWPFVGA